jgi:hypothetical protein
VASTMRFAGLSRAIRGSVPDPNYVELAVRCLTLSVYSLKFCPILGESTPLCQNDHVQSELYEPCVGRGPSTPESMIP